MKLLIAGDFVPQNRALSYIRQKEYGRIFGSIQLLTANIDYSIVNLECPLTLTAVAPIHKSGPNLRCESANMIEALKWAGFDCVTLANNHFRDYGSVGVRDTLNTCHKYGIDTVGGGENLEKASEALYKTIGEKKIAIINACEEEFSIATDVKAGSNPLRPISLYYQIRKAKSETDYIIVILHGGIEQYKFPTPDMQKTYRFLIDAGANVVINHHQHIFSGYEHYNEGLIFYGLGNFCFDRPDAGQTWKEGYMVELSFSDDKKISYKLHPYLQGDYSQTTLVSLLHDMDSFSFYQRIIAINEIISHPHKVSMEYDAYLERVKNNVLYELEPWKHKWIRRMQSRHLFPMLVSRKQQIILFDLFSCASHRNKLIDVLRLLLYKQDSEY